MKYILVGMHSSGKQEVIDVLESYGVKCGKLFTNANSKLLSTLYNGLNYEQYEDSDINSIFENNAYIFMQEMQFNNTLNIYNQRYFEGLSTYEFENNDVFVISPDQLFSISPTSIKEEVIFIWLDNTKKERLNRYYSEKRSYGFSAREDIEIKDSTSFVKLLYNFNNSNVLYFTNEDPNRIATIVYSLITYPDLLPFYISNFN